MKRLLICLLLAPILSFFYSSCKTDQDRNLEHVDSVIAEVKGATEDLKIKRMSDSIYRSAKRHAMFDTIGLSNSPVKVLQAKLIPKEYSNSRDMFLRWKNVSRKKIDGIKFSWYGINAFGDPAEMGDVTAAGFGGGFTDETILPGKVSSGTWEIFSKDGKKIVLVWPCEVAFADGTKWKSSSSE